MQSYRPDEKADDLFEAMLRLKNLAKARAFFRDLCTLEEIKNMADRWKAAQMLARGIPYRKIAKKLDLSTATVSRVAYWLRNGTGGYKSALAKLAACRNKAHHRNPSFGKGLS